MLSSLTIQNVVLIDRMEIDFAAAGASGLAALTGETGAGKSILLDALGLALGARAEASLVRHGAAQASVTACFDLPAKHPVLKILKEKDIDAQDTLILRRTLSPDGRSKAFINDAPVSVQLLKEAGAALVEIHGQFDTQGLLNPETHGQVLDNYAGIENEVEKIRAAWAAWRDARKKLEDAKAGIEAMRLQEDYLRHTVAELEALDPQIGEEKTLAEKRHLLLNREKMQGALAQAAEILEGDDGLQALLGRLQNTLEKSGAGLSAPLETLARAKAEIDELAYQVERIQNGDDSGDSLEDIEDRYFSLKECAKKHRCAADDLPRVYAELAEKLTLITCPADTLAVLEKAAAAAKAHFLELAGKVSAKRQKAAQKLAKAVNAELPDLKLDKATFFVECAAADESGWGHDGIDRVQFAVSTNPQTPAGPLHKIASGGELARFMLALKAILAETGSVSTLIFDEVDSGIGGATAFAVGERLARLGETCQVLVVTHSPQVAARASHHWIVAKTAQKGTVITQITPLKAVTDRQEEIARMLSGSKITAEARAAALSLLQSHAA